jgi:D-alanyl-D-alanine carboxypeptidase
MTSGIVNFTEDPLWIKNLNNNFQETWTSEQILDSAYQQTDYFKPGQAWRYSNTNYILLGKIIENKTQQPLAKIFESEFFKPLALKNSYYSDDKYSPEILKRTAHGYDNNQDMTATILVKNVSNIGPPGGGMLMSTTDLEKWIGHLLIKKDIIPAKQLKEMLKGVAIPDNKLSLPHSTFGLGLGIARSPKLGEIISYAGTFPGYGSTFVWLPEKNILIIVQMNVNRYDNDESSYLHFPSQELIQGVLHKFIK